MKLMLDTVEYKSKPNNAGAITNRLIHNPVDISIEELAQEIIKGKSFTPAIFTKLNGQLKRSKDNWVSQQILCIDFDNTKRNEKTKEIEKYISMTINDAIDEFKNIASFIYTSFNHTEEHPKFRVVIQFNREVTDKNEIDDILLYFKNKYPNSDQGCYERGRLFYGGRNIVWNNYNNYLNIDDLLNTIKKNVGITKSVKGGCNNNISDNILIRNHLSKPIDNTELIHGNNIKLIKNKDINKLREILNIKDEIVFYTKEEIRQYFKSRDLNKFLGVYDNTFNCLFHEDRNPSSGIIYDDSKDLYIYNCFSDNCCFGSGTIFKCVEFILECDKLEALEFLMDVYNVKFKETEWQQRQKKVLDENMALIRSGDLEFEYPMLHKRIKNYLSELHTIHEIAKDTLPPEHYSKEQKENLFYLSVRHLANLLGLKNSKRMSDRLALFAYLGVLFKLKDEEIPKHLLDRAEQELKKNKEKYKNEKINRISFFSIPSYTPHVLNYGQKKAIEFEEKGFTMKGWSYEMLLRALGEEEATRVYPVMKGIKTSRKSNKYSNIIEQVTMNFIESRGWVTEKLVINTVRKNYKSSKSYTEIQMKKIISEMVDKYNLKRERLNKNLRDRLNVDVKGYPYIIYKNN